MCMYVYSVMYTSGGAAGDEAVQGGPEEVFQEPRSVVCQLREELQITAPANTGTVWYKFSRVQYFADLKNL